MPRKSPAGPSRSETMSSPLRRENTRDEIQDARAWITVAVVVVIVLVAYLGISAGMASHSAAPGPSETRSVPPPPATPPVSDAASGGLGDLGALPGLLDDFSSTPDCDFDDALSTCQ